jgi:hypothetical protein
MFSLFLHCFRNIIDFWIAKRCGRGEMDENWLAARVGVGLAARALVLCHTGPTNERVERQARGLNSPERGGGRRS